AAFAPLLVVMEQTQRELRGERGRPADLLLLVPSVRPAPEQLVVTDRTTAPDAAIADARIERRLVLTDRGEQQRRREHLGRCVLRAPLGRRPQRIVRGSGDDAGDRVPTRLVRSA